MPWTRSILELSVSPFEVASAETRTLVLDMTNYLNGGTINSPAIVVIGGPIDSDTLWTTLTSTVYVASSVSVVGNAIKLQVHGMVAGFGYKVLISWAASIAGGADIYQRFVILRCTS